VRLKVQGAAGTTVTLRHAEVLDKAAISTREPARRKGDGAIHAQRWGLETYEPHFTFQGFRYVSVEGYPGEVTPESLTGIVIHSDMARRVSSRRRANS